MRRSSHPLLPGLLAFIAVIAILIAVTGNPPSATAAREDALAGRAPSGSPLSVIDARADGEALRATCSPTGALIVLPAGATAAELDRAWLDTGDAVHELGASDLHLGPMMRFRGRPFVAAALDPAARAELASDAGAARLELRLTARDAAGAALTGRTDAPATQRLFDPHARLLGFAQSGGGAQPSNRGGYLIVTATPFTEALEPLVDWKTECGYDVHLVTTEETGSTPDEIRDYIRQAYETWETPPLYVLLAGDVGFVPAFNALDNVSDHLYGCVDGDDYIADLYVGRFSAQEAGEMAVQVAKTVGYESQPDTTAADDWFSRALLVAGNAGSSTPKPTSRWIADLLMEMDYAQPDTVFYPPWWQAETLIRYYVDNGVSLINYRGWAQGDTAWQPPEFGVTGIRRLRNGWKLPVVFSIVCHTGNFGNYEIDCFGETWLKSGTVEDPRGAVGFIGTGEHHSHSRWNDRVDIGLIEILRYQGVYQLGPLLVGSKNALLTEFPTELDMETSGERSVEYYHYIYNLLGDPSLAIWTDFPRGVQLDGVPRSVSLGQNFLDLRITESDGQSGVAGAHVTFVQDGAHVGYGVTDANGDVTVPLATQSLSDLLCTVAGENLHPQQITIPVQEEDYFLQCSAAAPSGGTLLPGVASDLLLTATNTGTSGIEGATATIRAPENVTLLSGQVEFGPIGAGESGEATEMLSVQLDAEIEDGARLRFRFAPEAAGVGPLSETDFWVTATAPAYRCTAVSDGGDDIFDPGEEITLTLTLTNEGSISGSAVEALLQAQVPGQVTISDSLGTFPEVVPGAEGDNAMDPFELQIDPQLAVGTVIPMKLFADTGAGPEGSVYFNLVVGAVDFAAPVGPDEGGYYCYDSADIDYPGQVPVYRWVECSPEYGGSGTRVDIPLDNYTPAVIDLPFDFTYYGETFNSIRVSDNGWIAFDTEYWYDIRNWSIPDPWGCASHVAAFWDNLDPTIAGGDGIYSWYDEDQHRFVIEWSRQQNYEDITDDYQTFEILLYDPAYHPTASGNGEIVFQYKQIVDDDWVKMFSTVGIEDPTEEHGIQYCYASQYAPGAAPLSPGLAVKFTTEAPVYEPLAAERFTAAWIPDGMGAGPSPEGQELPEAGCVRLNWALTDERPLRGFEVWRSALESNGEGAAPIKVHEGLLAAAARSFEDR
ncbi:MAG: hypothetical protein GF330_03025, partial [Candidatus Eisenbacteria bacterium]|nr:hypothetical protein [Candidatus Eisenbacteria bacterium]